MGLTPLVDTKAALLLSYGSRADLPFRRVHQAKKMITAVPRGVVAQPFPRGTHIVNPLVWKGWMTKSSPPGYPKQSCSLHGGVCDNII